MTNPVRIFSATLAAMQVMVAGSVLADIIGPKPAALLALLVAAAQMGWGEYLRSQVTPTGAVVAQVNDTGAIVAGPASQTTTGAPVEEPVPLEPAP